jgi:hypothetical protein
MTTKLFKSGTRRYVCVNREAISYNLKHRRRFPTCIIVDEYGTQHEFHSVSMDAGLLKFDPQSNASGAKVFIETFSEIQGHIDEQTDDISFPLSLQQSSKLYQIFAALWNAFVEAPVVSCLIPEKAKLR